jgi:hypothetical protein
MQCHGMPRPCKEEVRRAPARQRQEHCCYIGAVADIAQIYRIERKLALLTSEKRLASRNALMQSLLNAYLVAESFF